jgi:hypothetical protein
MPITTNTGLVLPTSILALLGLPSGHRFLLQATETTGIQEDMAALLGRQSLAWVGFEPGLLAGLSFTHEPAALSAASDCWLPPEWCGWDHGEGTNAGCQAASVGSGDTLACTAFLLSDVQSSLIPVGLVQQLLVSTKAFQPKGSAWRDHLKNIVLQAFLGNATGRTNKCACSAADILLWSLFPAVWNPASCISFGAI